MSGLITLPASYVPAAPQVSSQASALSTMTAEQLDDMFGLYLPRIQLYSSNSNPVKDGIIAAGHWGIPLTPSSILDLGEEVDAILVAQRDKALLVGDDIMSSTDKNSAAYQKIRDLALTDKDSGAMFGPEFLTWVGPVGIFATLFLGSTSARREGPAFVQALNKAGTLYSQLVGSGRRKWEVPLIRIDEDREFPFALPVSEVVERAFKKFTAPDTTPEVAEKATGGRER
jgi:hypothetical protein